MGSNVEGTERLVDRTVEKRNCFTWSCPNWCSSRGAKQKAKSINLHLETSREFNAINDQVLSLETRKFHLFESTKMAMEMVNTALKDENIQVIGLYGREGVGKTTLVKEICDIVYKEKLFDKVVMTVVSRNANLQKIQGEIANMLDLRFEEDCEIQKATTLSRRLKEENRILVILDDVWERLELDKLGIPYGDNHKGCKIIITACSQDVCREMKVQKSIQVNILSVQEACDLFKMETGAMLKGQSLFDLFHKIVTECGGLPIALVKVATTLSGLFAEDEEAKHFLLFCCLFSKDHNIEIERMVRYGMGFGLFKNANTIADARCKMQTIVNKLKTASMLLDEDNNDVQLFDLGEEEYPKEEYIKMQDIVHDMVISIASSGNHVFMTRAGEELKNCLVVKSKDYTAICNSIDMHRNVMEHEHLKLQILLLQGNNELKVISDTFFEGMKELKVLDLSGCYRCCSLSIQCLTNLSALYLEDCNLQDISTLGRLNKLEILTLRQSSIGELPGDIAHLTNLKLLDLTCAVITRIPPNVITCWSHLEELYMIGSFNEWLIEGIENGNNASIQELESLNCLTSLCLDIVDTNILNKVVTFPTLKRFDILVGRFSREKCLHRLGFFPRVLRVNSSSERTLRLSHCDNLKTLSTISFLGLPNLRVLEVEGCKTMSNLMSTTLACKLLELKKLIVYKCNHIKQIIVKGKEDKGNDKLFPQLRTVRLMYLPKLKRFYPEGFHESPLEEVCIVACPNLESFTSSCRNNSKLKLFVELHMKDFQNDSMWINTEGNIIRNYDFSNDLSFWDLDNCGGLVSKNPDYYSGIKPISRKNYCVVLNRNSYWQGLRQDITARVSPGATYTVSTYVRVWGPVRGLSSVQAQLTIWVTGGRKFVLIRRVNASKDKWEILEGTFSLQTIPGRIYIDFEGPPPGVDLLISPVVVYSTDLDEHESGDKINLPISVGDNIILNHDFTGGLQFWNLIACNGFVVTEANYFDGVQPYSGKNYCVTLDRTGDWQGLEQEITNRVSPGFIYDISAFVRVWGPVQEATKVQATLRLEYPDLETKYIIIESVIATKENWEKLEGTFSFMTMPKLAIIYFEGPDPGIILLIDSVVVTCVSHEQENENVINLPISIGDSIIENHDFSDGLHYWELDNCGGYVPKSPDYYKGVQPIAGKNYCVVLNRNSYWQGLRRDITESVSAGTTYTVSTNVRVWGPVRGLSSVQAQLTIWAPEGRKFVLIRRVNASMDEWEKLEGTFLLESIPGRVYIDFEGPPPGVNLLISPVMIYSSGLNEQEKKIRNRIGSPISSGGNIILNHDFREGLSFWNLHACNGFVATESNYYEGVQPYSGKNYCVTLDRTEDWQGLEQDITDSVSPRSTYIISAFLRVWGADQESCQINAALRLEYPNFETTKKIIGRVTVKADSWVMLDGTFLLETMPRQVIFYFDGLAPGVVLLIDSVVIEEHKDNVEVWSSMDKIHEDNVGNEAYTNLISHH